MLALPGLGSMRPQVTVSWLCIVACSVVLGCRADSTGPSLTRGATLVMLARRLSLTVGDTTSLGLTLERNGEVVQRTASTGTGQRVRYSVLVSPTPVATPERFVHIDAGTDHTCALNAAGVVSCWGDNRFGQVGTTSYFEASPRAISLPAAASALSVGGDNSCAVLTDGTIRCWGTRYNLATVFSTGSSARFDSVSVGAEHVCARASDGSVWCWGDNSSGQLGTGDRVSSKAPTRVDVGASLRQVSAGYAVTCVVDIASRTLCWGTSPRGELGLGNIVTQYRAAQVAVPGAVMSLSAGGGNVCALNTAGAAYCWGSHLYGGLGIGPLQNANPQATDFYFFTPQRVLSQDGYRTIVSGGGTTCAITEATSRLDCWGSNTTGQLGVGAIGWCAGRRYSQRDVPTPVVRFTP